MSQVSVSSTSRSNRDGLRLFALSFAALFLELMVIRWVPAVVRFVAYYSNLMLISSFLGLGTGAMAARRKWNLFPFFPLILLIDVALLAAGDRFAELSFVGSESRFFAVQVRLLNYLALIAAFALNTAVFVPLGQAIGRLFQSQSRLAAYSFDLGGSLCGTVAFGMFSLYYFSPAIGMTIVAAIFFFIARGRAKLWNLPVLAAIVATIPLSTDPAAIWSPYYYVTIHSPQDPYGPAISQPPPDLRIMDNPPIYTVRVNTDIYQFHGTIDLRSYTIGTPVWAAVSNLNWQYRLPYLLHPKCDDVCVVGAGGGLDVEAALLSGAHSVDAVEIDRTLVDISRRFNASGVYDRPGVNVHINDARAFFQSTQKRYDVVAFGLLDSQALFSASNNIRLDGYIYTVQSIRTAFNLLKPDGMLCISFGMKRPSWISDKLMGTIYAATGQEPLVYTTSAPAGILCVSKTPGALAGAPAHIGPCLRNDLPRHAVDLPTDDWPYLYLSHRTVPLDYMIVIGTLLMISCLAVGLLHWSDPSPRPRSGNWEAAHFFFLGLGFLLLETKSIGDCSLYFGTTWLVTLIVVTGVLLMVLAANLIAMLLRSSSRWLYLPVLGSLALLYFMPRDYILGLPLPARLVWAVLVVPLPIFFAGLIFSTTFRTVGDPATLLGANLIGATIGGFLEYLSMALGTHVLFILVGGAYIISLLCRIAASQSPGMPGRHPDALTATSHTS